MDINAIHQIFPTGRDCVEFLEGLRWNGKPVCPYCKRSHSTRMRNECRYHCNICNAAYSVTVGTVFHGTKLPLQKWFLGIYEIVMSSEGSVTVRRLASVMDSDKNTAARVLRQINKVIAKELIFFCKIADCIRSFEDEGHF